MGSIRRHRSHRRAYNRERPRGQLSKSSRDLLSLAELCNRSSYANQQSLPTNRRRRRGAAAQRAAIQRVPVVVRDVPEEMALEMTLVENLQREDLNPIEQARAFQRLTEEFNLTQEKVAERTGKDRATIANSVRLLKLDQPIQDLLEDGQLTAGHGRALLAIAGTQERLELARRIARVE